MSQLDDFREQLRSARPVEEEKEETRQEVRVAPASKKMRRKKEAKEGYTSVWLSKDVQRKAKLLTLWLDAEGFDGPVTLGDVLAEALEVLIETRYPRAKKYVDR